MASLAVRDATLRDLPVLAALEKKGFPIDFFTEGRLRYLLTRARAIALVLEAGGTLVGSAIMVWRKHSADGHLYSIVVDPEWQGRGLGRQLLQAAEEAVARRGCARVLLETRLDNTPAISLYERHGYKRAGVVRGFYADGADALQMVKPLEPALPTEVRLGIPYYARRREPSLQASGQACLLMAMQYLRDGPREPTVQLEAGEGGPLHLAVAAQKRGYPTRVLAPHSASAALGGQPPFSHRQLAREARALGVRTAYYDYTLRDIIAALYEGSVPIALMRGCRFHDGGTPHWVVVTGFDRSNVYVHDPHGPGKAEHASLSIPQFTATEREASTPRGMVAVGRPSGACPLAALGLP